MQQVLFHIPFIGLPIYGFGAMLVVALFFCTWLAGRRSEKEGIAKEHIQDLAFWIVIAGIIGARVVFMIQYGVPWWDFYKVWQGGLVFYGALAGGVVGYLLGYRYILRRHKLSAWKVADILAPCIALGLAFGRVGCLLNGCCWGGVACPNCPALTFPINSFPSESLIYKDGLQTPVGFVVTDQEQGRAVGGVEAASQAARVAGLRVGDVIVEVNGRPVDRYSDLQSLLVRTRFRLTDASLASLQAEGVPEGVLKKLDTLKERDFETPEAFLKELAQNLDATDRERFQNLVLKDARNGKTDQTSLALTVLRDGEKVGLPAFTPRTLPLHPTQVYESVSMFLLFLLLVAYFPLRRHDGEVFALFLLCYPLHRFLNEMLRNDTDPIAGTGMTLSQNGSLLVLLIGAAFLIYVIRRPAQYQPFKTTQKAVKEPVSTPV
jgi:prolipoprotein diacylglyceryltransferase